MAGAVDSASSECGICIVAVVADRIGEDSEGCTYARRYYGSRDEDGQWLLTSMSGEHVMWPLADEQIVVLGQG